MPKHKMDKMRALQLAKQMQAQNRMEQGDPNIIGLPSDDPMRVLENYHRGFFVPPGTKEQRDAYRRAIDQRLYSQPLRERRRAELEQTGVTEGLRRRVADVVKPVSMAASLTPFDAGLGDLGYAAGELIDPEGTYGDAALAAAGGALTGGLGSGAILSKAAKEARALEKAAALEDVRQSAERMAKGSREARDFFDDLTPTVIKENPLEIASAPVGPPALMPGPPSVYDQLTGIRRAPASPPRRVDSISGGVVPGGPRLGDRQVKNYEDLINAKSTRFRDREVPGGFGSVDDLGLGLATIGGSLMIGSVGHKMLEEVRNSPDYGSAFSETTRMSSPELFDPGDSLDDVPGMLQSAVENAASIFEATGSVPSSSKRTIGKLEALMNTKNAMDASDDRAIMGGLMGFGADPDMDRDYEGAMIDREIQFKPSKFARSLSAAAAVPAVVEGPMFGPEEAPTPTFGPPDPTPSQMRQMSIDDVDEIEPAMAGYGE
tara:strand:+ start:43 stop:1509 length:1467 start_codon:yes stop_codon:yes gene_type:complete